MINNPHSVEKRRHACALQDSLDMSDSSIKDIANWLEHFNGYPTEDPLLKECEIETFVHDQAEFDLEVPANERYIVYIPGACLAFGNVEDAYACYIEHIDDIINLIEEDF